MKRAAGWLIVLSVGGFFIYYTWAMFAIIAAGLALTALFVWGLALIVDKAVVDEQKAKSDIFQKQLDERKKEESTYETRAIPSSNRKPMKGIDDEEKEK